MCTHTITAAESDGGLQAFIECHCYKTMKGGNVDLLVYLDLPSAREKNQNRRNRGEVWANKRRKERVQNYAMPPETYLTSRAS